MTSLLETLRAVDAKGRTIPAVAWTDAPPNGVGYAILDMGASLAERSGADRRVDVHIRCCGFSREQAASTLDRVRAAFTGWRPFPATRPDVMAAELDCGPAIQDSSVAGAPRWSHTITLRIES